MACDFDAALRGFDDLRPGQGVEVDTEDRGGRLVAEEIKLDA